MKKDDVFKLINDVFTVFNTVNNKKLDGPKNNLSDGKLYELFVLSIIVNKLQKEYGFSVSFTGDKIKFREKGGLIKQIDPHFTLTKDNKTYDLFVDVEVISIHFENTIEKDLQELDPSSYFESDITLVFPNIDNRRPKSSELIMLIECKSTTMKSKYPKKTQSFNKNIIREIIGMRSFVSTHSEKKPSILDMAAGRDAEKCKKIPANPASEVILYTADLRSHNYTDSPEKFGIEIVYQEFIDK